jgi:pimeloyl-ACP methyl ester carboxylesterase
MRQFRTTAWSSTSATAAPPDGEPVVLLHGFPQDSSAFDRMAPLLHDASCARWRPTSAATAPGPAGGRSPYRLREVTGDVLALLDAAGLQSAHVVGHDWGGAVAWALGAWHPGRVRTLTSLSTPHPAAAGRAVLTSDQGLRSSYMAAFQGRCSPSGVLLARDGAVLRGVLANAACPTTRRRYVDRLRQPGALSCALAW